jgi:hypothetical protein
VSDLAVAVTADQVNEAHRLARTSAESAVQYAIRCGELLAEVKAQLPRGKFDGWVTENCDFERTTAYNYLKLSKSSNALDGSAIRHLFPSGRRPEPLHRREPEQLTSRSQAAPEPSTGAPTRLQKSLERHGWYQRAELAEQEARYAPLDTCPANARMKKAAERVIAAWSEVLQHCTDEKRDSAWLRPA